MQGINLSRRPFVNRRPVLRLAILLWVIGAVLAFVNVKQYSGHWQGTSVYRQRLAEVEREVREEREQLGLLDQALAKVNLGNLNQRARFLNRLISYRTFPWSALFDDLEEALPLDVRLVSVRPNVKLSAEPQAPRRRRQTARRRPRTASTTAAGEGESAGDESPGETPEEVAPRQGEVALKLSVVAKTEDALLEFIDAFYADPSFRAPFVPGETVQGDGGTKFSSTLLYLVRPPGTEPEPAPAIAERLPAEAATEPAAAPGDIFAAAAGTEPSEDDPEAGETGQPTARREASGGVPGRARPGSAAPGAPIGSAATARGVAGRGRTDPAAAESESGGTAGRAARDPRRGRATAPTGRSQPRALPGSRPGAALPGSEAPDPSSTPGSSDTSGTEGTQDSGQTSDPPPPFAQPAASATPQLKRSALHRLPGIPGRSLASETLA